MSSIATQVSSTPAELPARIAARAIDVLIIGGIDALLGQRIGLGLDWLAISAAAVVVYFALMDAYFGSTPGKFAVGLRVIGPSGGRPSVGQAFVREAFTVVGAVPFVGPVLALGAWTWIVVTIRSSPLRQGKHDLLAGGTRVVRREA